MDETIKYNSIKDSVLYGFEEYINEEHYNASQAAARILEEDWRQVNYSKFTKASYFLNIAIESFQRGKIADFIFDKLNVLILEIMEGISKEEEFMYQQDLLLFKKLKDSTKYEIIKNPSTTRIDYLLNLESKLEYQ